MEPVVDVVIVPYEREFETNIILLVVKEYRGEKKFKLLYSPMCQVCGYPHSHSSLTQHSDWDVIFNFYYFVFLHF